MTVTYYPEQPRETRYIGFEERQLIKQHQHISGVGMAVLIGSLMLAAVSLIL